MALNRLLNTELGARAMAKTGRTMRFFNASAVPMLRSMFKRLGARVKTEFPKWGSSPSTAPALALPRSPPSRT